MEEGIGNITVDVLKDTIRMVRGELKEQFKNTRPFRQIPQDDIDRLANYLALQKQMTPDMDLKLQQDFGNSWANYKDEMEQLSMEVGYVE
jgi:parvulin-like peptidyl-prolyl isomerase